MRWKKRIQVDVTHFNIYPTRNMSECMKLLISSSNTLSKFAVELSWKLAYCQTVHSKVYCLKILTYMQPNEWNAFKQKIDETGLYTNHNIVYKTKSLSQSPSPFVCFNL